MTQGILTFPSVAAAMKAGFHVCGRYDDGYLVRTRTSKGWVMALAAVKNA